MKATLTRKVGFLLLLPFAGSILGAAAFASFLWETHSDDHFLNVAGRQRLLASEVAAWASMVAAGQDEDREGLRDRARQFEEALHALQRGGRIEGHEQELAPAPPEVVDELDAVAATFGVMRPDIEAVVALDRADPRFGEGVGRVEVEGARLAALSHEVVEAFERRGENLRRRMLWQLCGVAALSLATLVAGLLLTRRYIARPIVRAGEAARRIGGGDLSTRLATGTGDELDVLASAFNEMAGRVEDLLRALDLRRKHADTIIANVPAGLLVLGPDLTILRANRAFGASFGLDPEACRGRPLAEVLPSESIARAARETLAAGEPVRALRCEACGKDGEARWLRVALAETRLAEEGAEERLVLVVEDLTEEERLLARLRASERRLQEVLENAIDAMILADRFGRITFMNRAAEKMFGWLRAEACGKPLTLLMPEKHRPAHEAGLARFAETGTLGALHRIRALDGQRRDGSVFPVEISVGAAEAGGEAVLVGVVRDVSERREVTAKMMQVDRATAVGTLAAGVAHEINNPLAIVMANLDLAGTEIAKVAERASAGRAKGAAGDRIADVKEELDAARKAAERIRKIVRDLMVFSKAGEDRREPLDVVKVLESAVNVAWNIIKHRARFERQIGPIPHVEGSEAQLGQVFLNLLVNAAQAIPEGQADRNEIRMVTRTDASGRAVIEVRDTGSGIPPDVLPRIFDPFFTTKPVGQGTGLGLTTCLGIVHGLGGEIEVETQVGKGTTMRVVLPPAFTKAAPAKPERAEGNDGPRRGRILIVDDEPEVASVLRRLLAQDHDATAVTAGREALERIAAEPFDVILCDLMMPEMTGMDLHEEVSRRFPALAPRMIFLTGGAFTPLAREFLDLVPNPRLDKPVDVPALRETIRRLLG